jgi:hypothetical protein
MLKVGQCEALGLLYTVLAPLGLGFSYQPLGNTLSGSTRPPKDLGKFLWGFPTLMYASITKPWLDNAQGGSM